MSDRISIRRVFLRSICLFALTATSCTPPSSTESVVVFSASSLTDVSDSLVSRFKILNPEITVVKSDAGSSLLGRQIELGAPFDIYLTASIDWLKHVQDGGFLGVVDTLRYSNDLVVVLSSSEQSNANGTETAESVLNESSRISIGDPAHVPAGMYARDALSCMGLWDSLQDRFVPTLDVRAALRVVLSGAVDSGIVYSTDLTRRQLPVVAIRNECQPSIRYGAGLKSDHTIATRKLYDFINSDVNGDVWEYFGFYSLDSVSVSVSVPVRVIVNE